jgi:sugar phosphate isomerase/epimerase
VSGLTLWGGSVLPFSFKDRLIAARAGGFDSISLFPFELRQAQEAGIGYGELRSQFEGEGVRIAVVDPLVRWLPDFSPPPGLRADDPATGAFEAPEVFEMANALGADLVTLLAVFSAIDSVEDAARHMAELCDRASAYRIRLQLEFIPGTGVPDLATAWEIVRTVDRPNGGLVLDAWHFFRSGPDFALLGQIPPEKVFALQLNDAPATPKSALHVESLHGRLLPGEGDLEVARFARAVLDSGARPLIGPEVFSDSTVRAEPATYGRRLRERTLAVLPGGSGGSATVS